MTSKPDQRDGEAPVRDNPEAGRFELRSEAGLAYLEYRPVGRALLFSHTEVPEALEGRGIGGRLVQASLEAARERGLSVIPMCPFVAAYLRDHPEYRDLVHPAHRAALGI